MSLEGLAALGSALCTVRTRQEAADAATRHILQLFAGDAVILWMGTPGLQCSEEQIFAAGQLVGQVSNGEIARAIAGDRLEQWLGRRGAVVYCTTELAGEGLVGVLVVAWRHTNVPPNEVDAVLPFIATQLQAVAERQRLLATVESLTARAGSAAAAGDSIGIPSRPEPLDPPASTITATDAQLWRSLIEGGSQYVFAKDLEGRYVAANHAYLDALGRRADETIGRRDEDLLPEAVAKAAAGLERRVQLSGRPVETSTTMILAGRPRELSMRRMPWRNEQGHCLGVIAVATDHTDAAARVQELELAGEQMRQFMVDQIALADRAASALQGQLGPRRRRSDGRARDLRDADSRPTSAVVASSLGTAGDASDTRAARG